MEPLYLTVARAIRESPCCCSPAELASMALRISGDNAGQFFLINVFAEAFPEIPLQQLKRASRWHKVAEGGMNDEAFDEMLKPFIPACRLHRKTTPNLGNRIA